MLRFISILMLFATPVARGESAADKLTVAGVAEFTAAYQAWNGAGFVSATELFRQATKNAAATATNFYWLGVGHFHRMLQLQNAPGAATNQVAASAALESAVVALTTAVTLDVRHAESHALLGTLYGMKINGSLARGAWFGPRVAKHRGKAMELGATNPRVQYLLGLCLFHTANKKSAWEKTLATLLGSEMLYASEAKIPAAPLEPRWGHDSCRTFIGRTYEKLGKPKEAEDYFRRALAIHPQDHMAQEGLKRVAGKK